jgi:monoamine oxidase
MKDVVNYASEGGGGTFDRMSIAEYFDSIDAKGWMRELLEVAYVTEYGLEADEQSALNFIFLIATGKLGNTRAFELLGKSDERYQVREETSESPMSWRAAWTNRSSGVITWKPSRNGDGFTLTFQSDGSVCGRGRGHRRTGDPFYPAQGSEYGLAPLREENGDRAVGIRSQRKSAGGVPHNLGGLGYPGHLHRQAFQLAWDNSFLQHRGRRTRCTRVADAAGSKWAMGPRSKSLPN